MFFLRVAEALALAEGYGGLKKTEVTYILYLSLSSPEIRFRLCLNISIVL